MQLGNTSIAFKKPCASKSNLDLATASHYITLENEKPRRNSINQQLVVIMRSHEKPTLSQNGDAVIGGLPTTGLVLNLNRG